MDKNNQKIFVFGATGYVGQALVDLGQTQQIKTLAHLRPDSRQTDKWKQKWASVIVDRTSWNVQELTKTFEKEKPTHVFCTVGTTRERARQGDGDYFKVDYGYTQMLVNALNAAGVKAKFIYLSSLGASLKSLNPYLKARGLAEQAVSQSGLPFIIARPGLITGPNRDEKRLAEQIAGKVMDGILMAVQKLGFEKTAKRYRSTNNTKLAASLMHLGLGSKTGLFMAEDL
ncbi:NAD(P)H-binding protein [bacterium]|nr:NAD(P)H-binding protein [bacterium]